MPGSGGMGRPPSAFDEPGSPASGAEAGGRPRETEDQALERAAEELAPLGPESSQGAHLANRAMTEGRRRARDREQGDDQDDETGHGEHSWYVSWPVIEGESSSHVRTVRPETREPGGSAAQVCRPLRGPSSFRKRIGSVRHHAHRETARRQDHEHGDIVLRRDAGSSVPRRS